MLRRETQQKGGWQPQNFAHLGLTENWFSNISADKIVRTFSLFLVLFEMCSQIFVVEGQQSIFVLENGGDISVKGSTCVCVIRCGNDT